MSMPNILLERRPHKIWKCRLWSIQYRASALHMQISDYLTYLGPTLSCFGGLGVACCLYIPKFVGSNPAGAVRIFQGEKILSASSFRGEVKPSVPCRQFAACKRSLNGSWKSTFGQNYGPTFSPTVPPFVARISRVVWTWRRLVAEVGTSKPWGGGGGGCSGAHNKPIGCGASVTYTPGPFEE
jgi:hypothetical protein